jgi:hypothetical protein
MRRTIGLGLGAAVVAALLAGCGGGADVGALALSTTNQTHTWCSLPSGAPSIVLSDTAPQPSLTVQVGSPFVVTVPPWYTTHATVVSVNRSIAAERCSVLLPDGGRRTIFVAQAAGTSWLGATVSPASGLFMPAWGGQVVVTMQL